MKRIGKPRRSHSLEVRQRAFSIWQKAGFNPWKKPGEVAGPKKKKRGGDFYKGAFDSIPFLNDDAKRTFQHLLLRPGYMIRDYINGEHERYLAPLTSLIVFYAFFALVVSVLQPVQHPGELPFNTDVTAGADSTATFFRNRLMYNVVDVVKKGYVYLNLDRYPDAVQTQRQSSLAALEGTLRSQGIPLFFTEFLFLWLSMSVSLKRYRLGRSAYAAASAYALCQFSFFMLFAVLFTWGKTTSIGPLLMLLLLAMDYHQWLGVSWTKGVKLSLSTGIIYGLFYFLMILLVSLLVLVVAYLKL